MYRVMYGTRRGGNTAQPLQFPVQFVEVFSRRTGTHTFKNLLHRVCQSCIHLQNVGYFPRLPLPQVFVRSHPFKLMEQTVILRESVILLYGKRNIPALHQGPVEG